MPKALLSREQWGHVHATAVALGSIREAAKAHGVSEEAAYKRAQRERWLVGKPATVEANRAVRVERAKAAGAVVVSTPTQDAHRGAADTIDAEIVQNGRETRAMLSQALRRAAGQARKTKHPLAKARHIRDVASAAATVHPDQFGDRAGGHGESGHDAEACIQAAIVMIFGDRARDWMAKDATTKEITDSQPVVFLEEAGEPPEPPQLAEGTVEPQ